VAHAELRARLVAAQLSGLLDALAIFPDESIASADETCSPSCTGPRSN